MAISRSNDYYVPYSETHKSKCIADICLLIRGIMLEEIEGVTLNKIPGQIMAKCLNIVIYRREGNGLTPSKALN